MKSEIMDETSGKFFKTHNPRVWFENKNVNSKKIRNVAISYVQENINQLIL